MGRHQSGYRVCPAPQPAFAIIFTDAERYSAFQYASPRQPAASATQRRDAGGNTAAGRLWQILPEQLSAADGGGNLVQFAARYIGFSGQHVFAILPQSCIAASK